MLKTLTFTLFPILLFSQTQIGSNINGEAAGDQSGSSVSLSSNGNIIAIGAKKNGTSGHVRVYENQSGTWTQIGNDIDGESTNDNSGSSVSLSSNGNILAIGATDNDGNGGNNNGHVRVFQFNDTDTWNQMGNDIDGEAPGDGSGFNVSLSANGNILAISARTNDANGGNNNGHVRVFEYNGVDTWNQIGNDIDGAANSDQFGESLDLSSNGTIVAIGSAFHDGFRGHVRIFEYNGVDTWNQIGSDIDGELASEQSGTSLSLSSNGNFVAIGAPLSGTFSNGRVRVYENQSGSWTKIGSDIVGGSFHQLGSSLNISSDGNIVTIGAVGQTGRVLSYKNIAGVWTQTGNTINGDAPGDLFAGAVSSSSDGSIVAIGASKDDDGGIDSGKVTVHGYDNVLSQIHFDKQDFSISYNSIQGILSIRLKQGSTLKNVNLYNNLGQHIRSSKKPTLQTLSLEKGVYFVELETNKGKSVKKIVLE